MSSDSRVHAWSSTSCTARMPPIGPTGSPESVGMSAAGLDRACAILAAAVANGDITAGSVAVCRGPTMVLSRGFGVSRPPGHPAGPGDQVCRSPRKLSCTLFPHASLTRQFPHAGDPGLGLPAGVHLEGIRGDEPDDLGRPWPSLAARPGRGLSARLLGD